MQIGQVMTRNVVSIKPTASVMEAAREMKKIDVGALPVCGNDRLVGMITDRDIVLRGVADHPDLNKVKVTDIMTPQIEYCLEDQPVEDAARLMREKQIRRLVVLDQNHQLVGIVSMGDLAVEMIDETLVGETIEAISQPATPKR